MQIRPRPLWRTVVGPVPAALLALFVGLSMAMAVVVAAVATAPLAAAVAGGCAVLGLWAARCVRTAVPAELTVSRPPPRDAA